MRQQLLHISSTTLYVSLKCHPTINNNNNCTNFLDKGDTLRFLDKVDVTCLLVSQMYQVHVCHCKSTVCHDCVNAQQNLFNLEIITGMFNKLDVLHDFELDKCCNFSPVKIKNLKSVFQIEEHLGMKEMDLFLTLTVQC